MDFDALADSYPTAFGKVGLVNTHWAIILPALGNVFGIFLMRQAMQSIPNEFMEAGRIDGASEFLIFGD